MIVALLEGLALGVPAAATPGPFQAYLLAQTARSGWRRTLPAALAPLLSDGPIIALVLLVLTALPGWLLPLIRTAGGLFLLYLAWGAYRTFRTTDFSARADGPQPRAQSVLEAALVNLLGPGAWLFWATVGGPTLLEAWRAAPLQAAAFLIGFYTALLGTFTLYILLFGAARSIGPRLSRGLTGLSALLLLGFAIYQLWNGAAGLLQ
ncbi:MAG: LysE family translocator [Anaerolineae bacterium]